MSETEKKTSPPAAEADAPVVAAQPAATVEPTGAAPAAPEVESVPTVSTETAHEKAGKEEATAPIAATAEPAAATASSPEKAAAPAAAPAATTTTTNTETKAPAAEQADSAAPSAPAAASATSEKAPETLKSEKAAEAPSTEKATAAATAATAATNIQKLWEVAKAHAHKEIWGVTLADPATHVPSQIVLQKYLNANDDDFAKAKDQLVKTLDWRQKMKPLDLTKKAYPKSKFGGLGYITSHATASDAGPDGKDVFTWNVYGATKSMEDTFGDLEQFIQWRVALMELALQELSLSTATKPITATEDPYKIYQVHDYKSISFLRQPPAVKTASRETISVFSTNYPELLKEKFFVNVPAVMGFMYGVMKLFVAPKTLKKFHPMSNGAALANEFAEAKVKGLGDLLPAEYGGKGAALDTAGKQTLLE